MTLSPAKPKANQPEHLKSRAREILKALMESRETLPLTPLERELDNQTAYAVELAKAVLSAMVVDHENLLLCKLAEFFKITGFSAQGGLTFKLDCPHAYRPAHLQGLVQRIIKRVLRAHSSQPLDKEEIEIPADERPAYGKLLTAEVRRAMSSNPNDTTLAEIAETFEVTFDENSFRFTYRCPHCGRN